MMIMHKATAAAVLADLAKFPALIVASARVSGATASIGIDDDDYSVEFHSPYMIGDGDPISAQDLRQAISAAASCLHSIVVTTSHDADAGDGHGHNSWTNRGTRGVIIQIEASDRA